MENFPLLAKSFEIPLVKRKEKEILDLIGTLLNKLPRLWSKVGIFWTLRQRRIHKDPVKHLRWSFFLKYLITIFIKSPSSMFDRVLNTPLCSVWHWINNSPKMEYSVRLNINKAWFWNNYELHCVLLFVQMTITWKWNCFSLISLGFCSL